MTALRTYIIGKHTEGKEQRNINMFYCTKCGRALREEEEFCPFCGEPVRDIGAKIAGAKIADEHRSKRRRAVRKAGLAFIAVLAVGAGIWSIFSGGLKDHTRYESYYNEKVCFSVDYPQQYSLTESEKSKALITDGEKADFQVEIQYAYKAPSKAIIYSAEDFAQLASWDSGMLTQWLGLEGEAVKVTDFKEGELGGKTCYEYEFKVKSGDAAREGRLCIADSEGEFGCYSFMSLINKNAENVDLLQAQRDAMERSFKITKAYQPKGYKRYDYEKLGIQFVTKDTAKAKNEQSEDSVVIYPAEGTYTKASIWIKQSEIKGLIDVRSRLQDSCDYYFSQKKRAKYLSQPAEKNWGRYSATGADLEFYDKGEHFTVSEFVFSDGGLYTTVTMKSTDEYLDLVSSAAADVLYSLKFGNKTAADGSEKEKAQAVSAAQDIVYTIENQPHIRKKLSESLWC